MEPDRMPELISNYSDNTVQEKCGMISRDSSLQEAKAIRQSKGYEELPYAVLPNSGILLRARVTDSFCFVDHPRVELDPAGGKVISFSCDCPDWRMDRRFCPHCAALLIGRQEAAIANSAADVIQTAEPEAEIEADGAGGFDGPELMDLSYTFCNSRYDLYPLTKEPRIPLERYIQVYGNNARARALYNEVRGWGGSCFGFVSTSTMFYQPDSETEISDFDPDAQIPSELKLTSYCEKLGMTLHSFVEALQIMQYGSRFGTYLWTYDTLDKLAETTEAFQNGEGEPVCMGIWSASGSNDGHAILPFRLERTEGSEDILHIYDPNHPLKTRFGYLEKDEAGSYINWRFAMNDSKTYGSKTGGELCLSFYDVYKKAWDNRGGRDARNLMRVKPGMAILDAAGELLARVTRNGTETFCDDIVPLPIAEGSSDNGMFLSVPAGAFRLALEDPDLDELSVHLIGIDLTIDLSTVAREAEVCVDDENMTVFARISMPNAQYSIEIMDTTGDTEKDTLLHGVTAQEEMRLLQKGGKLYANGLTEQAALYIDRVSTPLAAIGKLVEDLEENDSQKELEKIPNASAEDPKDPQG